jgi:hypothetical protein
MDAYRLVVVLLVSLFGTGTAGRQQGNGGGAISGVVADGISGKPLAHARVSLHRAAGAQRQMLADAQGRFVFLDLALAEDYYVSADAAGYGHGLSGWTNPNPPSKDQDSLVTKINLRTGRWVGDVRVLLWRLGSIAGRIVDELGDDSCHYFRSVATRQWSDGEDR